MKVLLIAICLVLAMAGLVMAEQDIMVWNPRTPAGGAYVPDASYWFNEALIALYGERVINFYVPPITTNYYYGGSLIFGGTTNFVSQDEVGSFAIMSTDFNAQSGSMSINVGK